jgi:hypothetical protein
MGHNTAILVHNDRLGEIERDPEGFVREMCREIQGFGYSKDMKTFFPGQSAVMSVAHADQVTILAVGGNHSTVLGRVHNGGNHHTVEDQEFLLKRLADEYGFRLVRKPKKRRQDAAREKG